MNKLIVKTTGSILLICPHTRQEIGNRRPYVVENTPFIQTRIASSELVIMASKVPEGASDAEFVGFWLGSDKDNELAVESYVSVLEVKYADRTE